MNKEIIANFEFNNDLLLQSLEQTSLAMERLKNQQKQLTGAGQMSSAQYIENKARLKELNAEMNEGLKILNNRNKQHNIDIDNYSREGKSIRELRKDSQDLIKVRNEMILNGDKSSATFQKINQLIDENTAIIKGNVSAYEQQKMNIGNYSQGIVDAWEKIKTGDVKGAVGQIGELGEAWRNQSITIGSAWKSIAAIPVAGWIAGITAVFVMGLNEMIKYNDAIYENAKKLDNLGIDQRIRPQIEALAESFQVSFDQIAGTIDNLLDLGIVKDEAQAIEELKMGLLTAPDKNDFLAEIENTAQTAQRLGMGLSNIINIKRDIEEGGLDSGKIFGGMETSITRLLGQAEKVKPILTASFGEEFTSKLYKGVTDKTISYGDALNQIYKKGEELKISDQERADIAKSLFGKSSASAFDYNETLGLISKSYRSLSDGLTDIQKVTLNQVNAYEDMKKAKDEALKSDSIIAFRQEFEVAKLKIQTLWYNLITIFRETDRAVLGSAAFIRGVFKSIPQAAIAAFAGVMSALGELVKGFQSGGKAIGLFLRGEFEQAGVEFGKFTAAVPLMMGKLKNSFTGFGKDLMVGGATEAGASLGRYDARTAANADIYKANNPDKQRETPAGPDKDKDKKDKEAEAAAKKAKAEAEKAAAALLKIAEADAKAKVDLMKYQLDEYLATNQSKIDSEAFVTEKVLEIEDARNREILAKKKAQLDAEKLLELSNKDLTETQKKAIEERFKNEKADLDREYEAQKLENENLYSEQKAERDTFQRLTEHQTKLREMEENFATEFELKQEQLDFEYEQNEERKALQKELDLIEADTADAEKLERKAAIEAALNNIEAEYSQNSTAIEEAKGNAKLDIAGQVAGAIANIAGKESALGKAAAIAETGINTYKAATAAYGALAGIPVVGPALGIAAAALAVGSGLANVAKIVGIKVPDGAAAGLGALSNLTVSANGGKKSGKKAEKGIMLKGPSHAGGGLDLFDQFGNHLVNAEGGEMLAVINKKSTLNYLSDINEAGGGIPLSSFVKRAESGGMINTAISNTQVDMARVMADAVYQATLNGTYAGSQKGMKDLSTDRQVQLDATY